MIGLHNISIGYDARLLIRDLSFDQPKGSVLTVIGSNGSGKSTLLRTLHGLQAPETGEVFWDGRNLSSIDRKARTRLAAGLYGDFARVEGFTVWDLVALGRSPYTDFFGKLGKEDEERIHEAIMATGIEGFETKQIVELSDGEFRKVMLAKMLAQDTELLILDEPTTHLDLPAALEFVSLLKDLSRSGKTIVMSTHHLALGFKLSDSMLLLDGRENWALGSPREIMEHELLCHFLKTNKIKVEDGNLFYEL